MFLAEIIFAIIRKIISYASSIPKKVQFCSKQISTTVGNSIVVSIDNNKINLVGKSNKPYRRKSGNMKGVR